MEHTNTITKPISFDYLRPSKDCKVIKVSKPSCPAIYTKPTAYNGTTTSNIHLQKYMTTMGKIDTSDLVMIISYEYILLIT